MRIKTFLLGIILVFIIWLGIPYLLIYLNGLFNLPVYSGLLLKETGMIVFIFGLLIVVYFAIIHFKTGRVTPLPLVEKPKKFIVGGLYKYCRNPMYLAILLTFFGEFLFFGYALLLLYVLIAFPILHLFVVQMEEPELRKIFGKEYVEYVKNVPRWFPKF